eukprot:Nk52_evm32s223 gene=Nk52_evmTU32s223
MRVNVKTLVCSLRNEFAVELIKLPTSIRNMSLKEFCCIHNGDVKAVAENRLTSAMKNWETPALGKETRGITRLAENSENERENCSETAKKRKVSQMRSALQPITENNVLETDGSNRIGAIYDETPAVNSKMKSKMWGATPLVTPKFDPRLPKTPAVLNNEGILAQAKARPSISVTLGENRKHTITVPLDGGDVVEIDTTAFKKKDLSQGARKDAFDKLSVLQNQVAALMAELAND